MKILGPERYRLQFGSSDFVSLKLADPFKGLALIKKPKLYVASVNQRPIYVGMTKQKIRDRLRSGWSAKGRNGYHGYHWRHDHREIDLDIWLHDDAPEVNGCFEMETIEAELVFLIRCAGQWPSGQTEIHFHPSTQEHRDLAKAIMATYDLRAP